MSLRVTRRGLLLGMGAAALSGAGIPTAAASERGPAERLFGSISEMAGFGPRFTGGSAHRRYLDWVQYRLETLGLTVKRYPVPLDGWWARSWSLRVTDAQGRTQHIPVAYYRPHSGETAPSGVTAKLVDVGAGTEQDYTAKDVRGRIVLADFAVTRAKVSGLFPLTDHYEPPDRQQEAGAEDYTRIAFASVPPSLELARQHGAVAMVDVIDLPPQEAAGQYSPHQQAYAGLPALHLDRDQGARLRAVLAQGPVTATLVLDAAHRQTTTDYLVAELPGSGRIPGAVLVGTHTDGQNAVEENGGPVLLALARYFCRLPASRRPRDLLFVLSPNHMCSDVASVKLDRWLTQHQELTSRITHAITPEHLGTLDWVNDPSGGYGPNGLTEIAGLGVGNSDALTSLVIDQVQRSRLDRSSVLRPYAGGLYGEGTYPYQLGIPTVQYISGPTYLVQVAPGDHLDKLSPTRLYAQTRFLADLVTRILSST